MHWPPAPCDRCLADEWRDRAGPVHRILVYRCSAFRVLLSRYRAVHQRRPCLSRFHYQAHAEWSFWFGGGGDLCGGDVVVAKLDRGDSSERSLQTVSPAA